MSEPLYELTVNFKDLTDDGVRMLQEWIISSPETAHMVYWMSKAEQEDDEQEDDEQEDDEQSERIAKWINDGAIPTSIPGEYVGAWKCSNCGKIITAKTAYCPYCGAEMEVSGDA